MDDDAVGVYFGEISPPSILIKEDSNDASAYSDPVLSQNEDYYANQSASNDESSTGQTSSTLKKKWRKTHFSSAAGAADIYESISRKNTTTDGWRNWNEEYQQLIDSTFLDEERELSRTQELRSVCEEFGQTVAKAGKTIITELFLDDVQKSVPPITGKVGGVAGGAKYFCQGIFFKLPVDEFGIYGGDEGIIKTAGHELRGVMSLLDCRIKGLHFPLMVLCDYLGWRLLASSLLPLGKDTLVYGSNDGGKTILTSNPEMNSKIETAAKLLNVKGEYVWNSDKSKKTLLHLSCDVEGHFAKDKRFYLVDSARLFPPVTPRQHIKGDFLANLMRPEFVKSHPTPLCSDSFSGFGLENKSQHNQEVRDATERLLNSVIPAASDFLKSKYPPVIEAYLNVMEQPSNDGLQNRLGLDILEGIIIDLHRQGVNLRYLGLVRSNIKGNEVADNQVKTFLLLEIVARIIKRITRHSMRQIRVKKNSFRSDAPYVAVICNTLNTLFMTNQNPVEMETDTLGAYGWMWKWDWNRIVTLMGGHFENALSESDTPNYIKQILSVLPHQVVLLQRLQVILGFKLSPSFWSRVYQNKRRTFELEDMQDGSEHAGLCSLHVEDSDVVEMYPIIKQVHRIFFEEGTALSKLAASRSSDELFQQAQSKYRESLMLNPNDYRSLANWGLLLYNQASHKFNAWKAGTIPQDIEAGFKDICQLFEAANGKMNECVSIQPSEFRTYNKWGTVLYQYALFITWYSSYSLINMDPKISELLFQACKKFEIGHAIAPSDWDILFNWGNTLLEISKNCKQGSTLNETDFLKDAIKKYEMATACGTSKQQTAIHIYKNLAVSLARLGRVSYEQLLQLRQAHSEDTIKKCMAEYDKLFEAAYSKYQLVSQLASQDHEIYYNCANTLYRHALLKEQLLSTLPNGQTSNLVQNECMDLFSKASLKYFHALKLHMTFYDAIMNWTRLLMHFTLLFNRTPTNTSLQTNLLGHIENYLGIFLSLSVGTGSEASFRGHKPVPPTLSKLIQFIKQHYNSSVQGITPSSFMTLLKELSLVELKVTQSELPVQEHKKRKNENDQGTDNIDTDNAIFEKMMDKLTHTSDVSVEKASLADFLVTNNLASNIQQVQHKQSGIVFALKTLKKDSVEESSIQASMGLDFPFLVKLHSFFTDEKKLYMLFDYVAGGSLTQHVTPKSSPATPPFNRTSSQPGVSPSQSSSGFPSPLMRTNSIPNPLLSSGGPMKTSPATSPTSTPRGFQESAAKIVIAELILALQFLHSKSIIYSDLRPQKILFDLDGHIKLIQKFDIKDVDRGSRVFASACDYLAPEILEGKTSIGSSVDYWSVGVITHYLLTGTTPFIGKNLNEKVTKILKGEKVLSSNLSPTATTFINELLNVDVSQRSQFVESIQKHPFFEGIDWNLLASKSVKPIFVPEDPNKTDKDKWMLNFKMSDTVVMPNARPDFLGFSFAVPQPKPNDNNSSFVDFKTPLPKKPS